MGRPGDASTFHFNGNCVIIMMPDLVSKRTVGVVKDYLSGGNCLKMNSLFPA